MYLSVVVGNLCLGICSRRFTILSRTPNGVSNGHSCSDRVFQGQNWPLDRGGGVHIMVLCVCARACVLVGTCVCVVLTPAPCNPPPRGERGTGEQLVGAQWVYRTSSVL